MSSRCVIVNMLLCDIAVSEFKLPSCCYVHFRSIIVGKGMNWLIPHSPGLNSTTNVLLYGGFGIKYPTKVDVPLNNET